MTLADIFDTLHDAGFAVTVNEAHTEVAVSLNRPVNKMEVWAALGYDVDYSRLAHRNGQVIIR